MHWNWYRAGMVLAASAAALFLAPTLGRANGNQAGSSPRGRTATIHVGQVFDECQRQKDLNDELHKKKVELDDENQRRLAQIDRLKALTDAIDAKDPAKLQEMRKLMSMQLEYKVWFEMQQAELAREVAVWTARIYGDITAACETIAKRDGYDVVLFQEPMPQLSGDPDAIKAQIRNRVVVYADPRVDVSQAVLDQLNATFRAQPGGPMLNIP